MKLGFITDTHINAEGAPIWAGVDSLAHLNRVIDHLNGLELDAVVFGGDLADAFLFHAQAHGEGRDHHRRHLAAHDLAEQGQHFIVEDFAMLDTAQQRFLGSDGHVLSRFV